MYPFNMCLFPNFEKKSFDWTAAEAIGPVSFSLQVYTDKGTEFIGFQGSKRRIPRIKNSTHAYRQVTRRGRGAGSRGRSRGGAGYGSRAGRSRGAARSPRRPPPPRRRSRGNARAPGTSPPRAPARRKPAPGTSPSSSALELPFLAAELKP
jgi:hypothetical protein